MITKIKKQEGFSPIVYDDKGWPCQCYGQRLAFYDRAISDTATIEECDIVVKRSLWKHINLVKRIRPKSRNKKLIDMAYISYTFGVRKLLRKKI